MAWSEAFVLSEVHSSYISLLLRRKYFLGVADKFPFVRRPIDYQCFADDIFRGEQAPLMRVFRVVAVIAEDEELSFANRPFAVVERVLRNVGFLERNIIDQDPAIVYFDGFTGQSDDAFDQILFLVCRQAEYDNIAALWFAGSIGQPADKYIFAMLQGGPHAEAVDAYSC